MTHPNGPNSPLGQACGYLRRIAAADPTFSQGAQLADDVTVLNIERIPGNYGDAAVMVYDLSDGTTIRLDVTRYPREESVTFADLDLTGGQE